MRKNYLWYQLFRYPIVGGALRLYYKKLKVTGREYFPKNKPILFVPNHQNSFMDALLVVCTVRPFIYFLTRAEAFRPPLQGWFLGTLNMLPVYRVRDGFSSIQKNNAIFEECFRYYGRNDAVLIFPEANHNLKRRIRPLSKGFTRLAFGGEEYYDWELDLQIVPVGLNYTAHREPRNIAHVCYGKPIPVKKYHAEFKEDEKAATDRMKAEVSKAMKKLVFHAPNLDTYPVQKLLWEVLEPDDAVLTDPATSNKRIKQTRPHITEALKEEAKALTELAEKHDVDLRALAHPQSFSWKDALMLPVYGFSLANNAIPYQAVRHLTTKVIKDHAFDASIKFLTGVLLLPLFYLVMCGILALAGVEGSWLAAYFGVSVISAPAFIRAKEVFRLGSTQTLKKKKPQLFEDLTNRLETFRSLRHSIINE
ncbi:1-acyl-sn-glycerol-3-phosphate acyltransferase [Gracilimonas mengyeensis]|uniref:1-acyl-sn-glycerol-3-phosphate acyltransferase n=1 Tax=Gracilimonas mengyeensis TaxID=1302730 RepID=A0A521EIQ4_9BACT|nr:1-acyl-sn-glycerol-3-phosphate acyltransferase [Gracilimonas mengyeensis]SMO83030.1 1-acyl-sn-glycerol-3-phosphate acyltransferase [Gracilimonas mengyeensis]